MTVVFTTTSPFSIEDVEGQILPVCPVGYERNPLGIVSIADRTLMAKTAMGLRQRQNKK